MENLKEYLRAQLADGATVDELCTEFTDIINEIKDDHFQEDIMDPLLDCIDAYYDERFPKEYRKTFPDGISQGTVETALEGLLEAGVALRKLETIVEEKNLDPDKIAEELARRIFA